MKTILQYKNWFFILFFAISINALGQSPGNALAFDGSDDFVDVGNAGSVQMYTGTIEAWIKTPDAGDSFRGIVVKQWAYALFLKDNILIAYQWIGGNSEFSTGINLADNRWHHVALCFNSGVTNGSFIYIDGALTNTITYLVANQDVNLGIGNGSVSSKIQNLQGSMDEVRVWSTFRTQSEIQSTLYTELAGTESGLLAYFNCNQGVAGGDNSEINFLTDLTSNGIDGALNYFTKTGTTSNFVESYALAVPVPAAATNNTGTDFTANWAAPVTGTVSSYKLDVSTSSTFDDFIDGYEDLDCGTSLSQVVSGLTAGTTYYYRIKADKTSVTGSGGYYRTPTTVSTSCTNPTSGGTIAGSQTICAGSVPAEFTNIADPSGQAGTLEYTWQQSTSGSSDGFSDIASGNSETYAPEALSETTWYKRLSKVTCDGTWPVAGESNVLEITANQPSFTPGPFTVANLQATGTNIQWYAAGSGGTALASGDAISNGTTYYASQTVNGVESTQRLGVAATIDPTPCAPTGSAAQIFTVPATVASLQATGSNIRWYTAASGGEALATSTVLVNGTHYYASQTISCTESAERLDVTVTPLAIGSSYGGGLVAYILQSGDLGYSAAVPHGLIAATVNQSTAAPFFTALTGVSTSLLLGYGASNTTTIINTYGNTGSYAAKLCRDYRGGDYADWFLPSKNELNLLYLNIGNGALAPNTNIGNFSTSDSYWSSSQNDANGAYRQSFNNGVSNTDYKPGLHYVRAIRSF